MILQWSHVAMGLCSVGAALAEVGAQYVNAGNALPWHLTAGAALAACTVLGTMSKSILADQGKPAPAVTVDVLKAVADSLSQPGAVPTVAHVAMLDAVKQNLLSAAPVAVPSLPGK